MGLGPLLWHAGYVGDCGGPWQWCKCSHNLSINNISRIQRKSLKNIQLHTWARISSRSYCCCCLLLSVIGPLLWHAGCIGDYGGIYLTINRMRKKKNNDNTYLGPEMCRVSNPLLLVDSCLLWLFIVVVRPDSPE